MSPYRHQSTWDCDRLIGMDGVSHFSVFAEEQHSQFEEITWCHSKRVRAFPRAAAEQACRLRGESQHSPGPIWQPPKVSGARPKLNSDVTSRHGLPRRETFWARPSSQWAQGLSDQRCTNYLRESEGTGFDVVQRTAWGDTFGSCRRSGGEDTARPLSAASSGVHLGTDRRFPAIASHLAPASGATVRLVLHQSSDDQRCRRG